MSPKKKKKLKHQTHEVDDKTITYIPHKIHKGSERRGIRKFITESVDLVDVVGWECENYEEVYN